MSDLLCLSLCLHKNGIHVLVQKACCLLHSGCTRVPSHPKSRPPFVACIYFDIHNMLQPMKKTPTQHSTPYLFMAGTVCKVNYLIFKSYVIRLSSSIDFLQLWIAENTGTKLKVTISLKICPRNNLIDNGIEKILVFTKNSSKIVCNLPKQFAIFFYMKTQSS